MERHYMIFIMFCSQLEDIGDTIEKIRIGHDNSGIGSGWHLEKVTVRRLHETGKVRSHFSLISPSKKKS